MKRLFLLLSATITLCITAHASEVSDTTSILGEESTTNNWGAKQTESKFHLGMDLQTKYIWRGMEMMSDESAPVLFPSLNYQSDGLYVYAMGGYSINGKYAEIDLGASYTYKSVTLGINNYYYPTTNTIEDNYFKGGKQTGHWLEAVVTYAPENIPLQITASNFFYGADKYTNEEGKEKQAYSTYLELGTYYDFLDCNRIALALGAALNKSCYNGYEKNFSICNVELKYTYNLQLSNRTLPLSVAYIHAPVRNKSFVNFTANIAF